MRDWLDELDEIDQDCVHQYEYLLGRQLTGYDEYHEIDSKVDEMILEFETKEEFFEAYPDFRAIAHTLQVGDYVTVDEAQIFSGYLLEIEGDEGIVEVDNHTGHRITGFMLADLIAVPEGNILREGSIEKNDGFDEEFVPDEELFTAWLDDLLMENGKESTDELTPDEIREAMTEVKGTISNERLWAHADPIHQENIVNLEAYLELLEEMLEKNERVSAPVVEDKAPEMLNLWGRLGISLAVTPEEMALLSQDNRAAHDLLVELIQSDRCKIDGNTYFPYKDDGRDDNPEVDLEFELDPAPLHPAKEQSKAYIIAMADNVGYDVKALGPFFSEEEAKEELRRLYNGVREDVGEDSIECANIIANSFSVQTYGTDLYYANIKEMALDRAEHSKTSEKGYSEVIGAEQPRSLADRISSAKEKSDQSGKDASATPEKQNDR